MIVGHRGAPGYRPEHTAAAYELAIDMGADVIETDIVASRDGVLIARHENELSRSTDVASRPEFAARRTTRAVGGVNVTGWFAEDFRLVELRRLRAVERMPTLRPLNTTYDGQFGILTFAEVVGLARRRSSPERRIRVLAELKHPTWSAEQGLPTVELLAAELRRLGATEPAGTVVVQSFDAVGLRHLRARMRRRGPTILQLIGATQQHDSMTTPNGLREISTYAQGIAPCRHRVILRDADDAMMGVSDLADRAHAAGLSVVPWTVRAENAFLPRHLRRGDDPATLGDAAAEVEILVGLGVDGLITDHPDVAGRVFRGLVAGPPVGLRRFCRPSSRPSWSASPQSAPRRV
jgi:glycerophosphoryl diester phosphodiesterase